MSMDASEFARRLAGKFIVLDGPDGCGKSTQRDLLAEALRDAGAAVTVCRDPGGTVIGNRIRKVLLDYDLSQMNVNCEALLFMASRAQLLAEVVRPALERQDAVLCSRFVSATCAYQGAAGYDPRRVVELAHFAIDETWPHATIVLDIDVEKGFHRIGRKPHHAGKNRKRDAGQQSLFSESDSESVVDAMEARPIEFHRAVRRMFLELKDYYPAPVAEVDAAGDEKAVHGRVWEALERVLG